MDIKWTAGPGPAPLPYSKRARDAMGYSDDDKPWAHPDPPAAQSLGFTGRTSDPLREGRLRTNLFLIVVCVIVVLWVYRRTVKGDKNPFFAPPATIPSDEAKVTEENVKIAREARLQRFEEKKSSYADIMREAAGGWAPEGNGAAGSGDVQGVGLGESNVPEGLIHRGTRIVGSCR